jgi:hypothetical protein
MEHIKLAKFLLETFTFPTKGIKSNMLTYYNNLDYTPILCSCVSLKMGDRNTSATSL